MTIASMSVTDFYRLTALRLERSQVVPAGRVIWCRGRKLLGYGQLSNLSVIPKEADTVCLSSADYDAVRVRQAAPRRSAS